MKELAINCTHEHPCLSMILDPTDCVWRDYFTKEELVEIEEYEKPVIAALPTEMSRYLKNYKNLAPFHRIKEPDMYWAHTSVSRAIDVLLYNIHQKYKTESDLIEDFKIESCFDEGNIAATSGKSISKAAATLVNSNR
ncbi:hypothetical protein BDC45DRAFT_533472 [Circinella umbellata]|nr:hypothetical protein BDC45DRAFT_533472 [Circinella umbellata]